MGTSRPGCPIGGTESTQPRRPWGQRGLLAAALAGLVSFPGASPAQQGASSATTVPAADAGPIPVPVGGWTDPKDLPYLGIPLPGFAPGPGSFWVASTQGCPQVMGTDPWAGLTILQPGPGGQRNGRDPRALFAQAAGRPVLIVVNGNLVALDRAAYAARWTQIALARLGALPPDTVVVAFDWPSQRVYHNTVRDLDEKQRRAYVAGYHLARFLQAFPPHSRLRLLGHSDGGRVITSALHLLGGGELNSQSHDPPVRLPGIRPDLHLRAIAVAGADDHDWLGPGERLDRTLSACEAFLNLYNRRDLVLLPYPIQKRTGHHRALGRSGLSHRDERRLGPLAARYEGRDMHPMLGAEHTLLGAVAHPRIASWMAPYLRGDLPSGLDPPPVPRHEPRDLSRAGPASPPGGDRKPPAPSRRL